MAVISGLISVVFLIYLLMRIVRMAENSKSSTYEVTDKPGGIYDARPKLPFRTGDEIQKQLQSMPTTWARYPGCTPPLDLRIRGMTEELYRRFTRTYFEESGMRDHLDQLPPAQQFEIMSSQLPEINARAYVIDWRGATYPNGAPLPYAPAHLAALMRQDKLLMTFVSDEAGKLGRW
jgi:hypothetical protein